MDMMATLKRKPFLKCLIDLTGEALDHSMLDEGEELIGALRQLRPDFDLLDHIEAWFAIKRGNASDALRMAQRVVDRRAHWEHGLCQLAICKKMTGDPSWRHDAEAAFDIATDEGTLQMVGSMLGISEEEMLARRRAKNAEHPFSAVATAQFVSMRA